MELGLLPIEGRRTGVVGLDEPIDGLSQLNGRVEAGILKCTTRKNAEPTLDLVHPACMSWREVQVDPRMSRQPAVVFRLVRRQVVENDVEVLIGMRSDDLIHELEELPSAPAGLVRGLNLTGHDLQGGKQSRGSVAYIFESMSTNRSAIRHA